MTSVLETTIRPFGIAVFGLNNCFPFLLSVFLLSFKIMASFYINCYYMHYVCTYTFLKISRSVYKNVACNYVFDNDYLELTNHIGVLFWCKFISPLQHSLTGCSSLCRGELCSLPLRVWLVCWSCFCTALASSVVLVTFYSLYLFQLIESIRDSHN